MSLLQRSYTTLPSHLLVYCTEIQALDRRRGLMEAAADARPTEGAVGATEYARTLRVLLAPRMCQHLSLRFIRWFLDKTLKS